MHPRYLQAKSVSCRSTYKIILKQGNISFPLKNINQSTTTSSTTPLIKELGQLICLWTMRFESKHSYFKRCVIRTQNFKNVCKSLANNPQLLQSYMNSSSFFPPALQVKDSSPYHAELYSSKVCKAVEKSLVTPDSVSTEGNSLYKWLLSVP